MSEICLTLLCPAEIESKVLDLLLLTPDAMLFTSTSMAAHGLHHEKLNQTEQVLGHASATQVQVIIAMTGKDALLAALRLNFSGAGLRYWVTPIIEAGEFA